MARRPDPEGLISRWRERGRWLANKGRLALRRGATRNPIRHWSGVLDPTEDEEKHLAPLRAQLEAFDYRMTGLSDRRASTVLYIPVVDGVYVTPLATLDRSLFERQAHNDRLVGFSLHGAYEIAEVTVDLERLDDLDLEPTVIKLDTEEHELSCLAGMMETIERCSPILMIENNPQRNDIASRLAEIGYEPFLYDADAGELVPYPAPVTAVNLFYVRRG